jgi:hypothetical protein
MGLPLQQQTLPVTALKLPAQVNPLPAAGAELSQTKACALRLRRLAVRDPTANTPLIFSTEDGSTRLISAGVGCFTVVLVQ